MSIDKTHPLAGVSKAASWSFSKLNNFENCGYSYYRRFVKRDVQEPESEVLKEGYRIHEAFEARVKKNAPLPEDLQPWEPIVRQFVESTAANNGWLRAEHKMAITDKLEASGNGTRWSNEDWGRAVADLVMIMPEKGLVSIIDYKTGKVKEEDDTQLAVMALLAFATWPEIERVNAGWLWVKYNRMTKREYRREDAPMLWMSLAERIDAFAIAHEKNGWPKKKSGLCGYCAVLDCEHNRNKQ